MPVVGIGASAGGLEAARDLLGAVPGRTGAAFVLVQHLDPTHDSALVELLARATPLRVVQAEDGLALAPDHIYVIPPNAVLTVAAGKLQVREPQAPRARRTPVDIFMRSLAEAYEEYAIGIVLSGTGTEGAFGLRAIKGAGGLTIVQDPDEARHDGMPRNAIDTGVVDHVLSVAAMPAVVMDYVRHPYLARHTASVRQDDRRPLDAVLSILHTGGGVDFSYYKRATLMRRVQRRMTINHVDNLADYVEVLRASPAEVKLLGDDMLIGVTGFFRDPEAFAVLKDKALMPLVNDDRRGGPVRVWVPGCAGGEEVYSLAMLLAECLEAARRPVEMQIYGTDLDRKALAAARKGVYPPSIASEVTAQRLQRFFNIENNAYRVNRQLRESVTFAAQNLVSDPPFSRMDLISCRNLLIYVQPPVQGKILALLRFALRPGGYLFLGNSETLGRGKPDFEIVSEKWRIYRSVGGKRGARMEIPLAADDARPDREAVTPGPGMPRRPRAGELAQRVLLDSYAPASVLITPRYEVLYFHGATGRYLELPAGEPTRDLLSLARESLCTKLRSVVRKALKDGVTATATARLHRDGGTCRIRLTARPVRTEAYNDKLTLVNFEDLARQAPEPEDDDEPLVQQLEAELRTTRTELQTTVEELESSNEELRASSEEAMSMNEELQSTNEELETSKEELQSLNEELTTLNDQLQQKVGELQTANDDLDNLFAATNVATLFLGADYRVQRFTPAAARLYKLIASDQGRPLSDVSHKVDDAELFEDIAAVRSGAEPREREVRADDGRWYIRRILHYQGRQRTSGIVVTYGDVTQLKSASEALRIHASQQTRIAEVGSAALVERDVGALMEHVLAALTENLQTPFADAFELLPGERKLNMRRGSGWEGDADSRSRLDAAAGSYEIYVLDADDAVVVEDFGRDERFRIPAYLAAHGITSGMSIALRGGSGAFGLLGVYTAARRSFSDDDVNFLRGLANIVCNAIERRREETELEVLGRTLDERVRERTRTLELLQQVARTVNSADSVTTAFRRVVDAVCDYLDWPVGHAYAVLPAMEERFRELDVWSARARRERPDLVAAWRSVHPEPGEGLLGHVAVPETSKALPVSELSGLLRRRSDVTAFPKIAVLVPVHTTTEVVAVAEFYCFDAVRAPEEGVLTVLNQIGFELGRIVERQQGLFRGLRRQQGLERVARLALVGEMAGGIAHQLNQPLAAIMNYIAAARRMLQVNRLDRQRLVEIGTLIETQVKRVAEVVDQVRGFAQREPPRSEAVDVNPVIESAIALTAPLARAAGASVQFSPADNLLPVMIDRRQFQHAVVNLLINAVEAMDEFEVRERFIHLRSEVVEGGGLRVSIENGGVGIPEDVMPRLFEPFFSTKPGGTGMGLAISRSIVESYGGSLWVESLESESVVFHMELPSNGYEKPEEV